MAGLTTLRECPATIQAGDTLLFEITNANYPASDWLLSYSFRKAGGSPVDFQSTNDNGAHLISVSPAVTKDWVEGEYKGVARFTHRTDSTLVTTWWKGTVNILPDLSAASQDTDTRSWAKKCLDNIDAVLQGKASRDIINSTIAGQSIGRMTPEQLFSFRDRFYTLYQQELNQEAANQKKPQRSNIGISFVLPA